MQTSFSGLKFGSCHKINTVKLYDKDHQLVSEEASPQDAAQTVSGVLNSFKGVRSDHGGWGVADQDKADSVRHYFRFYCPEYRFDAAAVDVQGQPAVVLGYQAHALKFLDEMIKYLDPSESLPNREGLPTKPQLPGLNPERHQEIWAALTEAKEAKVSYNQARKKLQAIKEDLINDWQADWAKEVEAEPGQQLDVHLQTEPAKFGQPSYTYLKDCGFVFNRVT